MPRFERLVPLMSGEQARALMQAEEQADYDWLNRTAGGVGIATDPSPVRTVYQIPGHRLEEALARLQTLARKASRYATRPVTVEYLGGPVVQERLLTPQNPYAESRRVRIPFHYIRVQGEAPRVQGWTFVATLQHAGEAGTIVRAIPGAVIPEEFRHSTPERCDHCQASRLRRDTYVLRHQDGRHQQVGSTCLQDFLGGVDPATVARLCERLALLQEALGGFMGLGDRAGEDLLEYLGHVAEAMMQYGWKSRAQARQDFGTATADVARNTMYPPPGSRQGERPPSAEAKAEAFAALEFTRERLEAKAEQGPLSEFEHNLNVVVSADFIETRSFGIAAYTVQYRRREMEHEARVAAQTARDAGRLGVSEHVGQVGQRIQIRHLTVERIIVRENDWGTSHIHKMVDAQGNQFVWFASGAPLDEGRTYDVKATVMGHAEFRGVKETKVNRLNVERITGQTDAQVRQDDIDAAVSLLNCNGQAERMPESVLREAARRVEAANPGAQVEVIRQGNRWSATRNWRRAVSA